MDQKAYLSIATLMNAFPQGTQNVDLTMKTFETICADFPSQVVIDVAQRFSAGMVEGQSKRFAPSVAEFVSEVRRVNDMRIAISKKKSLSAPGQRFGPCPWEINVGKARTRFAGWTCLATGLSHLEWLGNRREFPVGSEYIATLNAVMMPPEDERIGDAQ